MLAILQLCVAWQPRCKPRPPSLGDIRHLSTKVFSETDSDDQGAVEEEKHTREGRDLSEITCQVGALQTDR